MFVERCEGSGETQFDALLKDFHGKEDAFWIALPRPDVIPPVGIQDIKWKELYDKWGKLIPEEKKKEFVYYNKDPGEDRRKRVAQHTKASKTQRKARSRTGQQEEPQQKKQKVLKTSNNKSGAI
jgi:hypothetical protein